MYSAKVTIRGLVPVCFNRPSDDLRSKIETRSAGGRRTGAKAQEEAEDRIYTNSHGIYAPRRWLKSCLLEGCTLANLKYGRRGLYPYLQGAVLIMEEEVSLCRDGQPILERDFIHERWGRIPPKTGALALLRNPGIHAGWEGQFTFLVGDDGIDPDMVRQALASGGALRGIGNGRPEFGRFEVTGWEVVTKK